jgi:hypothetical protein
MHRQVSGNYKVLGRLMQDMKSAKDEKRAAASKAKKAGAGGASGGSAVPGVLLQRQQWVNDAKVNACTRCQSPFTFLRRKHHCRICGLIFCKNCASGCVQVHMLYR